MKTGTTGKRKGEGGGRQNRKGKGCAAGFVIPLILALLLFCCACGSAERDGNGRQVASGEKPEQAASGIFSENTETLEQDRPEQEKTGQAATAGDRSEPADAEQEGSGAAAGGEDVSGEEDNSDKVRMPDFEMTLLDGTTAAFEDYRGKKIILNFWATWCGPCVREMPAFQRLTEEYGEELAVLAVNCGEDRGTVQKFVEKNGYGFPVILDEDGAIQNMFGGISAIPLTILIDEEGCIFAGREGAADADTMYDLYKEELGL